MGELDLMVTFASPLPGSILHLDLQPGPSILIGAVAVSFVAILFGAWQHARRASTKRLQTRLRLVRQEG